MAFVLGKDCHLYYKEGGVDGGGAWTEMTNIRDVKWDNSTDEADVSTRRGGNYKQTVPTLSAGSVEFQMVWDTDDAGFEAFWDAFNNRDIIGLRVYTRTDGGGLEADFAVTNLSRNEGLTEAVVADVTCKVTYSGATPTYNA